jgi:hypothetical protein
MSAPGFHVGRGGKLLLAGALQMQNTNANANPKNKIIFPSSLVALINCKINKTKTNESSALSCSNKSKIILSLSETASIVVRPSTPTGIVVTLHTTWH